MKPKKMISTMLASMLILVACFTANNSYAQTKADTPMMKDGCMMKDGKMMTDGCMMKDGKMMCMKEGKTMPMHKVMTMKNGTKCKANGKCKMKDGKKMKMKDGECMDMSGMMSNCGMMMKDSNTGAKMTNPKQDRAAPYTCPMHPEVMSDKPGKCAKCGMDLVKKK